MKQLPPPLSRRCNGLINIPALMTGRIKMVTSGEYQNYCHDPVQPKKKENVWKANNILKWVLFTIIFFPVFLIGGIGLTAMIYTLVTGIGIGGGMVGTVLFLLAYGSILGLVDMIK
jgi:hypothetical protein